MVAGAFGITYPCMTSEGAAGRMTRSPVFAVGCAILIWMAHPTDGDEDPSDFEVVPLDGLEGALRAFRTAGGVVDYGLVHVNSSLVGEEQSHRFAASTMIRQAPHRWSPIEEVTTRDRGFTYDADPSRATFERITVEEFVGPFYDWSTHRLKSPWVDGSRGGLPHGPITHGYADAFSGPPYPLREPIEKTSKWFEAINTGTFGGLNQNLVVLRWSTDWSNYFDAGHEWWGAYCWTVQLVGSAMITGIGVSSTD